ncbi:MAG: PfkB family carbohydrate kinase [Opitutales bacterium]|jgi:fructokinase
MSSVFCFGEVLWDCLPRGLFLGGAPLNVASHLARLGTKSGMISAVGDDILGGEALSRLQSAGVDTNFVSVLKGMRTGSVGVSLDFVGNPKYTIREDVAWDHIPLTEGLTDTLFGASALIFGTLAMRSPDNLRVLEALLEVEWPMRVYDVNLRAPFYTVEQALTLSRFADLVKCNEEEARELCGAPASTQPESLVRMLADATDAGRVCITLGPRGAVYLGPTGLLHAVAPKVHAVDSIGAGDAFLAAMVAGIVEGKEDHPDFLLRCCRLGAFVAASEGALPHYRASSFTLA